MQVGASGVNPNILLINTNDVEATILVAGYLSIHGQFWAIDFSNYQIAAVYTTDLKTNWYQISLTSDGIASFVVSDPNGVQVISPPVTDKNFAVFYGTAGDIQDLAYSPTNASLTKVVMAGSATLVNSIASFDDTAGTISCNTNVATPRTIGNLGDINSGVNGLVGRFRAFAPVPGAGTFIFQCGSNSGGFTVNVINNSHARSATHFVPDCGLSNDAFLTTALLTPDSNANLLRFDTTITTTALASAGIATLFASSGSKQYKIVSLSLNFGSNLLVGNRNLTISDGTTTYSIIPSASLLTMVNATWGRTAVPFPAAAALNTSTVAGASLIAQYSGGTTDYTTGENITISAILQRVA